MRVILFLLSVFISFSTTSPGQVTVIVGPIISMKSSGNLDSHDGNWDIHIDHISVDSPAVAVPSNHLMCINYEAEEEIQQNVQRNLSIRELSQKAAKGDRDAQYLLGCKYDIGNGTEQNQKEAMKWYLKAANQGHVQAQFIIGTFSEKNSKSNAPIWYRKAAEQGHVQAQCKMAYYYKFGYDVEQNYEKAFEWYIKAISHNSVEAFVNIANMYYYGQGTALNYEKAFHCFSKSLDLKEGPFMPYLYYRKGYMHQHGLGIERNYTEAFRLYQLAAETNDSTISQHAYYRIGTLYELGLGTEKNEKKAIEWYHKAAKWEHQQAQLKLSEIDPTYTIATPKSIEDIHDKELFNHLIKTAHEGRKSSQFELARMYFDGTAIPQNYAEALKWFLVVAEKGNITAQNYVGYMCLEGLGTEKNYHEAMKWLLRAARRGNDYSQHYVGHLYEYGLGVEANATEAYKWYRRAAGSGNAQAQYIVGNSYYREYYTMKQNIPEAIKWFRKAGEQGHLQAQLELGYLYENHPSFYDGTMEIDAPREAFTWYSKAAEQGHADAQCHLGRLFDHGYGIIQNSQEAIAWYLKAAAQGHEGAQYNLVQTYYDQQNYTEAMKWAMKVVENGNNSICITIGLMYANGQGVEKNQQEAEKWFLKTADNTHGIWNESLYRLAVQYAVGRGIDKDLQQSRRWMLKLAELGDPRGQYYLGQTYLEGNPTIHDIRKAYDLFLHATESGPTVPGHYYALAMMSLKGQVVEKDVTEAYKWLLLANEILRLYPSPRAGYFEELQQRERDGLTEEEKEELENGIQFGLLSGLYVPDLGQQTENVQNQMNAEQIAAARKKANAYLVELEQKVQKEIERINAQYHQQAEET